MKRIRRSFKKAAFFCCRRGCWIFSHLALAQESDDAGTYYTSAETTSGEVRCQVPVFPPDDNSTLQLYNWTISVSSDNSTWSNGTQVLVYDPLCVTCIDEGNQTTCLPSQVKQSHSVIFSCVSFVCKRVYTQRYFTSY